MNDNRFILYMVRRQGKVKHKFLESCITVCLVVLAFEVSGCSKLPFSSQVNYLHDYPAQTNNGLVNVVVEIPAGTNAKWEVEKTRGILRWEQKNGTPRVVQYLPYPGNYGMVPQTVLPKEQGGDGDPLDVLVLGPSVSRGVVLRVRPIGVLHLVDQGERDDKILAVQTSGPLSDVTSVEALGTQYDGILAIIQTWFTNYKGPGQLTSDGYGDVEEAMAVVREASQYYEQHNLLEQNQ